MLIRLPFTVKSMHAISKYTTCIFTVKMCKYVFRRTMFEVGLSITGKLEDELAFHHFFVLMVFCVYVGLCSIVFIRQQLLERPSLRYYVIMWFSIVHVRYFQYTLW